MLHTLHVANLALVRSAELRLAPGLNVLSGETGGGKSLVVTALKLLAGERAGPGLVRNGAAELQVDGEFRLPAGRRAAVADRLREVCGDGVADVAGEDDLLLVTRIVDPQGRSRVRIGGRPATLRALREIGALLLEIHGQDVAARSGSPGLATSAVWSGVLDRLAGARATERCQRFAAALATARELERRLVASRESEHERRQRLEFLRFQLGEMDALALGEGEHDALQAEHRVLADLGAMQDRLGSALAALQDDELNAAGLLARAARSLREAAAVDPRLEAVAAQLDSVEEQVTEVCRGVQDGLSDLDMDPGRLDDVAARLDEVQRGLRRFGPGEAAFRARRAALGAELEALEQEFEDPEALPERLAAAVRGAAEVGRELLALRRRAGAGLAEGIARELVDLGMPHTAVRVAMAADFTDAALLADGTAHGPVPVDLEVRINPGEPFRSLRETASGGELARIVLAVKKTLAEHDDVPLLVLDEIDAEVGARLGQQVGDKLRAVAARRQVVVVTHLPQVAACAARHFLVEKSVQVAGGAGRTESVVRALTGDEVQRELVAMGGASPTARKRASSGRVARSRPARTARRA